MATNYLIIPELTAEEIRRFRSKIAPPNEHGCELWTARCDKNGYGKFKMRQRSYRATRIAYLLHYHQCPPNLLVCHNCPSGDNPTCCAGDHLYLGTNHDNMEDGKTKGQFASGERNASRKLNDDAVRHIRSMQGVIPTAKLAKIFGLSDNAIRRVWNRETWTRVK